jgi:hypothetical protein
MFLHEFGEDLVLASGLFSRRVILRYLSSPARRTRGSKAASAFSKKSFGHRQSMTGWMPC